MKRSLFYLLFLLTQLASIAQSDFTGIAKYKITVEGNNSVTDSMAVVFGKQKIKAILYLPGFDSSRPSEKVFIDDFAAKKSFAINAVNKSYTTDTLNNTIKYNFINTQKIVASSNNLLCFKYSAESGGIDTSRTSSADCYASIDYRNSFITNYSFLGIQPVIVDNRIVMDFIVTQQDGTKQRIYVYDLKKMDDVESYFNLEGYKPG
jgi:hypothetical protein